MISKAGILCSITLAAGSLSSHAAVPMGSARDFAVLAGTTVTNTGQTVIDGGHVGVSPGTAITGFPPGSIVAPYTTHSADAAALQAQNDLTTAYNAAAALAPTQNFGAAEDIGGLTLLPGTYFFPSSAFITGTLTLDAQGDPNAEFVFQIGSTLITASDSSVVTINGGEMPGCNVFWQVGSSATLGTGTDFQGHILALTSITMTADASINYGSALARNGAVTLDNNSIVNCAIPEPTTMSLGLIGSALFMFRRKRVASRSPLNARPRRTRAAVTLASAVVCTSILLPRIALAGPIFSYGDFNANTIDYLDVQESSGTDPGPLYGAPTVSGDSLLWNPVSFNASSSGGATPDVTDGTLAYTIVAHSGASIPQIRFEESGDFTVIGTGTSATRASVAARVFITILEVDGVGISALTFNKPFSHVPSNGIFTLTDFPFPGVVTEVWNGTLLIDLDQELANRNITGSATRVLVSLNNTLTAISEPGTSAFIAKKTFSQTVVPEPSAMALSALGAILMVVRRRSVQT